MNRFEEFSADKREKILKAVETLISLHKSGILGGDIMPEDTNPGLAKSSNENYLYFTLPMALNYQRNSYRLWESAEKTYNDSTTSDVFVPSLVINMTPEQIRDKLIKYKLAVQPNKHIQIWTQLCKTFVENFGGSVRNFFSMNNFSIAKIKSFMLENKKLFPYLSGAKIMNYWLYVMEQYTDALFIDRINITVAPDTHVLQASVILGLITIEDIENSKVREIVSELWESILYGTNLCPIDIHTPLWLWSRGGFAVNVGGYGGKSAYSKSIENGDIADLSSDTDA
jgi:hypothetical protein